MGFAIMVVVSEPIKQKEGKVSGLEASKLTKKHVGKLAHIKIKLSKFVTAASVSPMFIGM